VCILKSFVLKLISFSSRLPTETRYRNDDHSAAEGSRRAPDSDSAVPVPPLCITFNVLVLLLCHLDPKILTKYSTVYLQEKNPRFREKGDSDEEDDGYDKRRRR
jgi:nuclear cap-binding protein subunit 2